MRRWRISALAVTKETGLLAASITAAECVARATASSLPPNMLFYTCINCHTVHSLDPHFKVNALSRYGKEPYES